MRLKAMAGALILFGLVLVGCSPFSPAVGMIAIGISTGSGAKTILPTISVASYLISFSGAVAHDPVSTTEANATIELEAGTWSISVEGLDAGGKTVAVGGQTDVVVSAGATTSVSIVVSAQASGSGTIDVMVSWPGTLSPAIDTVETTLGGSAVPGGAVSFTTGTASMRYLEAKAAGSYVLCITLKSGGGVTLRASVSEAVQVYGNLTSSATIVLTTADFTLAPAAPLNLVVTEGYGKLDVSWVDNSHVETGYVVERSESAGGPFVGLPGMPLAATTTSYSDTTVVAGTGYWYQVRARNHIGDSDPLSTGSAAMVAPPVAGGGGTLAFSNVTSASIQVSWTKATDNASAQSVLQYKVVRSSTNNIQTVADAQGNGALVMDWTTDVATASATGLSAGTAYWFNVLVRDAVGNTGGYSSSSQSTTPIGVTRIINHTNFDPTAVSDADIAKAVTLDVYFEHASVGVNISDGLAALSAGPSRYSSGRVSWSYSNTPAWYDTNDGLGDNNRGNPGADAKIVGFTSSMTASSGLLPGKVDVATYKFCYIDTPPNGNTLFTSARTAMESLQATYTNTVFVWWTMPIERDAALAERQVYNEAVRTYCSANNQWLLDIAALESHDDAGILQKDGSNRELLYTAYTDDGGHLNATGSLKLAKAYWKLLSEIGKTR
jgi:hypothetical protein